MMTTELVVLMFTARCLYLWLTLFLILTSPSVCGSLAVADYTHSNMPDLSTQTTSEMASTDQQLSDHEIIYDHPPAFDKTALSINNYLYVLTQIIAEKYRRKYEERERKLRERLIHSGKRSVF